MGKIKKNDRKIAIGQLWISLISGRLIEIQKILNNAAICRVVESPNNPREEGSITHVFASEFRELLLKGVDDESIMARFEN